MSPSTALAMHSCMKLANLTFPFIFLNYVSFRSTHLSHILATSFIFGKGSASVRCSFCLGKLQSPCADPPLFPKAPGVWGLSSEFPGRLQEATASQHSAMLWPHVLRLCLLMDFPCALYKHTPRVFLDNQEKASENRTVSNPSVFVFDGKAWSEVRAPRWDKQNQCRNNKKEQKTEGRRYTPIQQAEAEYDRQDAVLYNHA